MSTAAPIRWGLLGTARINAKLLAGAAASESARVVAVGSRSADAARAFAAANGIERAHGSYEDLLADDGVDAVYISLPNALHHHWTLIALAAGKHVLCEKPYSRHPEDVDVAWDAAEAGGLVLQEGFMWRHTPQAARLRELLPRIGELVAVRATFSFALEDVADIRVDDRLEGGSLMDVGCYCVSGARYVSGEEPELVFGQQLTTPSGVDRRFTGLLRFPSGLTATFHTSFDAFSESLEVIGRKGTIFLPDHGIRNRVCSSSTGSRSGSSRRTLTAASSTTWLPRSGASARRAWDVPMRSARHARSRRSTSRLTRGSRSGRTARAAGLVVGTSLGPRWDIAMAERRHEGSQRGSSIARCRRGTDRWLDARHDALRRGSSIGWCPCGPERGRSAECVGCGRASDVLGSPGEIGDHRADQARTRRRHTRADDRDVPSGCACPRVARGPSPGRPHAPGRTAFERPRLAGSARSGTA